MVYYLFDKWDDSIVSMIDGWIKNNEWFIVYHCCLSTKNSKNKKYAI